MPEARPNTPQPELALSPHYHSAVNAITQPDRMVFVSNYLVERWLPELGGDGLAILVFLRKKCYFNRRTGEKRDTITVSLAEIAHGCAISVNTARRQMQNNAALKAFVSWQEEYVVEEKRGGVIQTGNTYTISMDDPLHPDDRPRLEEELRQREAEPERPEDAKTRARQNAAQQRQDRQTSTENTPVADSQNGSPLLRPTPSQNGSPLPQVTPSQNGSPLREAQRTPILGVQTTDYFGLLIQTTKQQQQERADSLEENVVVASSASLDSLLERLVEIGVTKVVAERLVSQHGEEAIQRQLAYLPLRKCLDPAATLVRAIQQAWEPPASASKSVPRPNSRRKAQDGLKTAPGASEGHLEVMRAALETARRKVRRGMPAGNVEKPEESEQGRGEG